MKQCPPKKMNETEAGEQARRNSAAIQGSPTGRITTQEPQIQNIPVRTEEGKRIKDAFNVSITTTGRTSSTTPNMKEGEQTGSRWNVRDGLRSSEIGLLQRALAMYCREYQHMKGQASTPAEKAECDQYMAAADTLSKRLRKELVQLPGDDNGTQAKG